MGNIVKSKINNEISKGVGDVLDTLSKANPSALTSLAQDTLNFANSITDVFKEIEKTKQLEYIVGLGAKYSDNQTAITMAELYNQNKQNKIFDKKDKRENKIKEKTIISKHEYNMKILDIVDKNCNVEIIRALKEFIK